ncbi:MAG: PAS domain S-box protein [Candidatus Hydrothermarchaeales archaeon]
MGDKSRKQHLEELDILRKEIVELNRLNVERKEAEAVLQQRTHDLGERVKELNCLYGLSRLVSEQDKTKEEILQETVNLIPPSWQYPEIACSRIIHNKKEYKTKNFKRSKWVQKSNITNVSGKVGEIEVYYLKKMPELDEGPFLKEERDLINALAERLGKIIERKEALELLHESEEKYRSLVENSREGICIYKDDSVHLANKSLLDIFGYKTFEEFTKIPFFDHIMPESRKIIQERMKKSEMWGPLTHQYEYKIIRKDGGIRDIEASSSNVQIGGEQYIQSTLHDITERKHMEWEMKKRLMKFSMNGGTLYLVKESTPFLSLEAFKDLLRVGYDGLVISRTPKTELEKNIEGSFESIWLASRGEKFLKPESIEIENIIENLQIKRAILLDSLDFLLSKNGFQQTLSLVQNLREIAYIKDHIIIISIDPITLKNWQLSSFEKETNELESMKKGNLPEEILEVLGFIYKQNIFGVKPSHIEIQKELRVSKPTVWRRIRNLESLGYVLDIKKGRYKVLELTEKGKLLFSK